MDVSPALARTLAEQGISVLAPPLTNFQRRIAGDSTYTAQFAANGQVTGYVRTTQQGRLFEYFNVDGALQRSRTTSNNVTIWRDASGKVTGGSEPGLETPAVSPIDVLGPPAATAAAKTGAVVLKQAATKLAQVRLSRALVVAGKAAPQIVLPSVKPTQPLADGRFLLSRPPTPTTPTVIVAREADDWNGAFWNKDFHVLQALRMRVPNGADGKPIDLAATGVLMGHGSRGGIAHVSTREAAELIVDAAQERQLTNVVLHSCSQATPRQGLYGGTHAKALQAEVNAVLAERGITKPITLFAAHRPGITYGLLEVEGLDAVRHKAVYLPTSLQMPLLNMSREELKLGYRMMPASTRAAVESTTMGLVIGAEVGAGIWMYDAWRSGR